MRIGIIDDGIDITRPSFSGAGYQLPAGLPEGHSLGRRTARSSSPARSRRPAAAQRMRTAFDPDGSEHGTHVAGIAAGLSGITGTSLGVTITNLSGVAPHAYLGSYRVLTTPTPSFGLDGNGPEIARAIDRAVADGMDVLNLSLGEPEVESANDVVARAIHGAARAGVVTVVAAGNSGDDLGGGSISSPGSAPDAITVAATSVGRFVGVTLGVLGPGAVPADLAPFGAATDAPEQIPSAWKAGVPLVVATDCGGGRAGALVLVQLGPRCTAARADSALAAGCARHRLRPARRGRPDRDRRQPAALADRLRSDRRAPRPAGGSRRRRAHALGRRRRRSEQVSANSGLIASFSSRGPAPYSLALKPDVAAPGVDIVSPIPGGYGTWSGTSMATPAVAGAAALLHQRHPAWTPAQIKSALVLTARPVFNDTAHKHPTSVLAAGGGMIDVQAADAPGPVRGARGRQLRAAARRARARRARSSSSDAGGGGGTWTVSAPGPRRPRDDRRARRRRRRSLELALHAPPGALGRQPLGQHRAHLRDAHRAHPLVGLRRAPAPRQACTRGTLARRALDHGRHARGHAARRSSTAGRPARPAAACRARYPGREQLWSFIVPPGARNAGVEAEGAVVPQILLARDENRLAGEPALPSNGNPYLETYGRFERVSGLLVPGAGPLLRRRRDATGPQAGPLPAAPLDQRPHAAGDHAGPARPSGAPRTR